MGAAALAIMLFASMPSANSKEITISDLLQAPGQYAGEYIMTQGLLRGDSIKWDADNIRLEFEIYDEHDAVLSVYHDGIKPDNFSDGIIVIVKAFCMKKGLLKRKKIKNEMPFQIRKRRYGKLRYRTAQKDS